MLKTPIKKKKKKTPHLAYQRLFSHGALTPIKLMDSSHTFQGRPQPFLWLSKEHRKGKKKKKLEINSCFPDRGRERRTVWTCETKVPLNGILATPTTRLSTKKVRAALSCSANSRPSRCVKSIIRKSHVVRQTTLSGNNAARLIGLISCSSKPTGY